jgi:hypothetical protein
MSTKNVVELKVTETAHRLEEAAETAGNGVTEAVAKLGHRAEEATHESPEDQTVTRAANTVEESARRAANAVAEAARRTKNALTESAEKASSNAAKATSAWTKKLKS